MRKEHNYANSDVAKCFKLWLLITGANVWLVVRAEQDGVAHSEMAVIMKRCSNRHVV